MAAFIFDQADNALECNVLVGVTETNCTNEVISTSTRRVGFLFRSPASADTMTGFKIRMAGTTGTVTNGMQADLYAVDSKGWPTGSSLATVTVTPSAHAWQTVTWGASYSAAGSTVYAVIIKNVLGTPASNNFTFNSYCPLRESSNRVITSSDSGTNYTVSFKDGVIGGPVFTNAGDYFKYSDVTGYASSSAGSSVDVYNTSGSRRVICAGKYNFGQAVNIQSLLGIVGINGSPSIELKGCIYDSSGTILATSLNTITVTAQTYLDFMFDNYLVTKDTDYYVGYEPVNATSGDSSNYLKPWGNTSAVSRPAVIGPYLASYTSTATSPSFSVSGTWNHIILVGVVPQGGSTGSTNVGSRIGPGALIRN